MGKKTIDMKVNGCWEKKTRNRFICRWFVAWDTPSPDILAGAIAGYSGHAAFQVERFLAIRKAGTLIHFYYDFRDAIADEEIDFDSKAQKYLSICESALDSIWEWNDNDEWAASDDVILKKGCDLELERQGELLLLRKSDEGALGQLCQLMGLTAGPK
jgi:hypothetical protein